MSLRGSRVLQRSLRGDGGNRDGAAEARGPDAGFGSPGGPRRLG
jgi:hypothetical protein